MESDLRLVSTCPSSRSVESRQYLDRVRETAAWCEEWGHHGLLILSEPGPVDAWTIAQVVLETVDALRPMITLEPTRLHPCAAARRLAEMAELYGRSPDLVLAAGGRRSDLRALGDELAHAERYRRLVEYGRVLRLMLEADSPPSFAGDYYRVNDTARPAPPADGGPSLLVAASSADGRAAARELGAISVCPLMPGVPTRSEAVRIGLLARSTTAEAEEEARTRFPEVRARRVEHRIGMMGNDSEWQRALQGLAAGESVPVAWWTSPFEHGYSEVPYLVGDHRSVARELLAPLAQERPWLLLDTPAGPEDLAHTDEVVRRARKRARTPLALAG